ncbi:MAG TPA: extracellular solute-binding protein [Chloroflexota bacterium]|nr:extracellular solute-binding protein [Chloroflexota bacterium]
MESISRRQVVGGLGALAGALGMACAGAGGAGGGATLPAKQIRPGTTLHWRSYVNNEALLVEVDRLWTEKQPQVTAVHAFTPAAEILQKVIGEVAAGTPVDVTLLGYRDVPALQRHLVALEPYMRRDRYPIQEFVPAAIDQYRYGNSAYALPNSFPVRVGVYNASLFAERGLKPPPATWDGAGWTWDELANTARALSGARGGGEPVWGLGWDKGAGVPNLLQVILFCNNNGGTFLREDGRECLLTQPRSREALQFMQDLIQRWQVAPAPGEVAQPGADLFVQGKVAWASFGPASVAAYRRTITFDWAVGPLPLGPGGKQRTTVMDGSAWMLLRDGANRDAAWELLQTLVSPEYERAAAHHVGYVPPRRALMAEYASGEPPRHARIMLEASERTYLFPKTPWIAEADAALAPLLGELWSGKGSVNAVTEAAKGLLDPLLQRDFSFRTD